MSNIQHAMVTNLYNLEQKMECLINPIEYMKYKIGYIRKNFSKEINDKFSNLIDEYKESNPNPSELKGFVKTNLYKQMLKDEIESAEKEERDRIDDEQLFQKYKSHRREWRHKYSEEIVNINKKLLEWNRLWNLWIKEYINPKKYKYILELVEIYFGYDKIVNVPDFNRLVNL
jgi:hypothetical protein